MMRALECLRVDFVCRIHNGKEICEVAEPATVRSQVALLKAAGKRAWARTTRPFDGRELTKSAAAAMKATRLVCWLSGNGVCVKAYPAEYASILTRSMRSAGFAVQLHRIHVSNAKNGQKCSMKPPKFGQKRPVFASN